MTVLNFTHDSGLTWSVNVPEEHVDRAVAERARTGWHLAEDTPTETPAPEPETTEQGETSLDLPEGE